ncbi:MnhB domain-containing protein [Haladaptatus sp. DYSN1]|uniref:MnhB domain-containing protein n=1 Tax=unclassified Haladaptatus TaxID=2622732 RepID=UPI002404D489|nr:MnhB domain-containing protein [Haladaptatus sp. DYSN1]
MTDKDTTVISRTVTRIVVPLIFLLAIALLLQGHNLPGGGFIAGVLTVAAFALIYIIFGLSYLEEELLHRRPESSLDVIQPRIVEDYRGMFATGLILAAGSGIVAMTVGFPFLTQAVLFVYHVPIYHEIELASALVFDLGVYFVVVGALLTILGVVGAE